eukprot:Pgem_evm1s14432
MTLIKIQPKNTIHVKKNITIQTKRKENKFALSEIWKGLLNDLFNAPFKNKLLYPTTADKLLSTRKSIVFCINYDKLNQHIVNYLINAGWEDADKQNAKNVVR